MPALPDSGMGSISYTPDPSINNAGAVPSTGTIPSVRGSSVTTRTPPSGVAFSPAPASTTPVSQAPGAAPSTTPANSTPSPWAAPWNASQDQITALSNLLGTSFAPTTYGLYSNPGPTSNNNYLTPTGQNAMNLWQNVQRYGPDGALAMFKQETAPGGNGVYNPASGLTGTPIALPGGSNVGLTPGQYNTKAAAGTLPAAGTTPTVNPLVPGSTSSTPQPSQSMDPMQFLYGLYLMQTLGSQFGASNSAAGQASSGSNSSQGLSLQDVLALLLGQGSQDTNNGLYTHEGMYSPLP